jgi:predicted alpha/beta-hydrolase family hydrolase
MLFLQGARDRLASLDLLRTVLAPLGARADLRVVEDADHSFHVTRRSGRSVAQVIEDLAEAVAAWRPGPPHRTPRR